MRTYSFDSKQAEKAESDGRGIHTTGAYILNILQCAAETSPKSDSKAEWLTFVLGTQDGTKVITRLVTAKSDGTDAFGLAIFQSLMGLLGIQACEPKPMKVYSLNGASEDGYRITAVEKKPIGVLLQYVEDKDKDGYARLNDKNFPRYQMVCKAFFDPKTRQTFSEKKDGKPAKRIDYLLTKLQDEHAPVRAGDGFESAPHQPTAAAPATQQAQPEQFIDDPIPF